MLGQRHFPGAFNQKVPVGKGGPGAGIEQGNPVVLDVYDEPAAAFQL